MSMTEVQVRGVCGELRDLKRRFAVLTEALGGLVGLVDGVIDHNRRGERLNNIGLSRMTQLCNEIVRDLAAALNTTPEELAGGLLPEE